MYYNILDFIFLIILTFCKFQKIFEADYIRDREQWKAVKEAKKANKQSTSDDVGRTPHNSPRMDTGEAKVLDKIATLPSDRDNEMEAIDDDTGESLPVM